jgi:PAS domain S-box-containing protein
MVGISEPTWSDSPLAFPSFHRLIQSVADAKRSEDIYEASLTCLRDTLGVERSSILLLDDEGIMRFCAWRGLSDGYRAAVDGHSPWGRDTADPKPVVIEDVDADASLGRLRDVIKSEGIQALAFVPLAIAGRLLGKFMLYYPEPHAFSATEIQIAQAIASNVAFAIDQHEQREHLEAISRSTVAGIAEIDPKGRFRTVNDRFSEITGRPREELVAGRTLYDIIHPDDWQKTREEIEALEQGVDHLAPEKRVITPDGREVWLSAGISAVRGDEGRLHGVIIVALDITNRRIAQEEVRQSEERYRELVAALGLAVYTTDAEGRILLYNESAVDLWGRRPEVGKDLWCGSWKIFTPEGEPLPHELCPMAVALREQRPVRGQEILVERPDGSRATVLPSPTPLFDDAGRLAGGVNVLIDITERKRAESELARAYMLKDQFLSLVSHELRSPISTILGNALLLAKRSDLITEEDKQRAYSDIVSQTRKLHESIENLLLLTRLDSASIEFDAISLTHIAISASDVFHDLYPDRKVSFSFEKVPPVLGQETLVELVLQNLLTNAAKYSPPESEIELLIGIASSGEPEVRVRDHGIGLNAEDMANLFTPFYRSQRAKDFASGMGLGLAVCQRIMEVQNGSIGADARPDGGSDFYFRLPEALE